VKPSVADAMAAVEVLGGRIWLEQDEVRYRAPNRAAARIRPYLEQLREQRNQVVELLKQRDIPSMPSGVTLLAWKPKQPPVVLSVFSVVNDTQKFIVSTLQQLAAALRGDCWAAGNWSVRDLYERLEQVGVRVEVAKESRQ
jgi:hypothetical protein